MLALALMVPAYEVVIEFGVAMGLIALGVNAARRPRPWRVRWSIETALLAMVVAAVGAAVIGAAPTYGVEQWTRLLGIGISVAYFALLCLWVVYGRARTAGRIIGGIVGITVSVTVMYVGDGIVYASSRAARQTATGGIFQQTLQSWFTQEYAARWMWAMLPTVGLGVGVMLTVIAAARASGWFAARDPAREAAPATAGQLVARVALCAAFAAVAAPNLYLLYRLCTPPALPAAHIPADNGFDDFLAAGRAVQRINMSGFGLPQELTAWSDQKLTDVTGQLQEAYDLLSAGLSKRCWTTAAFGEDADMEVRLAPLHGGFWAALVRMEGFDRRRQTVQYVEACCQYIRLSQEMNRGQRAFWDTSNSYERWAVDRLTQMVGALTVAECRELIAQLDRIDRAREPMELKVARQHASDCRSSWQMHLRSLVAEWSGQDLPILYAWEYKSERSRRAAMHLLMTDLALQAYFLERGDLPASLTELTPNYLAEVPVDSLCRAPLRYHRHGRWYRVYSVGWDEEDDGGFLDDRTGRLNGDYVAIGPHLPPLPRSLKDRLALAAERVASLWNAAVSAAAADDAMRRASATAPR
jgi:hypothetical protein